MKIIFVLNQFLPKQTAGTEVYTWALIKHLQNRDIEVKIVIPNFGEKVSSNYSYDGISIYQYAEPSVVDRSLIMGHRLPDGLINFKNYIADERPDIVHFQELAGSNGITLQHVLEAKATGARVMMTFHLAGYTCKTGTVVYKDKNLCNGLTELKKCSICYLKSKSFESAAIYLYVASSYLHFHSINPLKRNTKIGTALGTVSIIDKLKSDLFALVSACDRVVAITNWYENILILNGIDKKKISLIFQGLPLQPNFVPNKCKFNQKPLRLIFLGRINKFKGLHLLIAALENIDPSCVQLSIFGNSDDFDYETDLRSKTHKMNNIFWHGKLMQEDVVVTLNKYHMLCLCSTFSEMSPLVIQEAFAAKIPVLAANVYGNAEQIQHNYNGLLFKFNNVEDLRIQILRCINEPDLINHLTKNISSPRSFSEVADEYFELYKNLLS